MKRLLLLLLTVTSIHLADANDKVRDLQSNLKSEGFYFGELDGKPGAELNAAIRRYQIRNGLTVTGEADDETLAALGLASAPPASPPPPKPSKAAPSAPAPPAAKPPVDLRKNNAVRESDRRFLEGRVPPGQRPGGGPMVPPPVPLDPDAAAEAGPSAIYSEIFAGTPYASAPGVVQRQTIVRAQEVLARGGFYRDAIDGLAGPATEEAILTYQRSARLPLTGRLDLQTLSRLRLLPGRPAPGSTMRPSNRPRQQVYRGMWVE